MLIWEDLDGLVQGIFVLPNKRLIAS
jgi:hypothetical protein